MSKTDLHIWDASAEPHEPVCVAGQGDGGLSLTLYFDEVDGDQVIKGGVVYDGDAETIISYFGWLPANVVQGLTA